MQFLKTCGSLLLLSVALAACGSNTWFGVDKPPITGERISIIEHKNDLLDSAVVQPGLKGENKGSPIQLKPLLQNDTWLQASGNARHVPGHVTLSEQPQKIWQCNIGSGASEYAPITSGPVASQGLVLCLDADSTLSAVDLKTGALKWELSVRPEETHDDGIGGGIAIAGDRVYVATPYAEVLCVSIADGHILWRQSLLSPARVSPTVSEGRVYVLTITNELEVFSAEDGRGLWDHAGLIETAGLLGGASPAIDNGAAVVAYSSGEVFALKAENGQELWTEGNIGHFQLDSVSTFAHVRARPVIEDGIAYIIHHNNKITAIDLRTGHPIWSKQVGGLHTPVVEGDYIFFISTQNELLALNRHNGQLIWRTPMYHEAQEKEANHHWSGPILAGGRLVVTGTNGDIRFYDAITGKLTYTIPVGTGISVSPIVVNGTLIVLTNDAELLAFK